MKAMRRLCLVVAAAAVLVPAATPAGAPANFHVSTVVPGLDYGSAPALGSSGQTVGSFPHIGRATIEYGATVEIPVVPGSPSTWLFTVTFATGSGDSLVLSSGSQPGAPDPYDLQGDWTVTEATGRFASYTGSGTFGAVTTPAELPAVSTEIALDGSLQPRG